MPKRLEALSVELNQHGDIRHAAYFLQFALVFGLYAMTCPVRGREFYDLEESGIVSLKDSLTIHFQTFKNVKACGDKWKVITRNCEESAWLIDVAQRVFSSKYQGALQKSCTRAFVTVTGKPLSESYWSSTISDLCHRHCCKALKTWKITVDGIRAAFITVFLNSNPSTHAVTNVAFAMNTSPKMLYEIYDRCFFTKFTMIDSVLCVIGRRCSCEKTKAGMLLGTQIYREMTRP